MDESDDAAQIRQAQHRVALLRAKAAYSGMWACLLAIATLLMPFIVLVLLFVGFEIYQLFAH